MDGIGRARPCWGMGFSGDEVWGMLAVRALLTRDIGAACEMLGCTRPRYQVGFLLRLGLVAPGAALRMAWRLATKSSG